MNKELLKGLSEEQIEKASHCQSTEELLKLAKAEGVTLTEEQLKAVNGGGCALHDKKITGTCPSCGATAEGIHKDASHGPDLHYFTCPYCGTRWTEECKPE